MDNVATSEFPFVQELPKRERSKLANLWDVLKEARAATEHHGSLVPPSFAADLLGISRQRLHVLMEEGKLETVTFHGKRFVGENSLVAWAKAERQNGRPVSPTSQSFKACIANARELLRK